MPLFNYFILTMSCGNDRLNCDASCYGAGTIDKRVLLEAPRREGINFTDVIGDDPDYGFPEISEIMFDVSNKEDYSFSVKDLFDLGDGSTSFEVTKYDTCCRLTWNEKELKGVNGETSVKNPIAAGNVITLADLADAANLGGYSVGDRLIIQKCGDSCAPIVTTIIANNATPSAAATTVTTDPLIPFPALVAGDRIVRIQPRSAIGECKKVEWSNSRFTEKYVTRFSYPTRIGIGFNVTKCEAAIDRKGYHWADYDPNKYLMAGLKDNVDNFVSTLAHEIFVTGTNEPSTPSKKSSTMSIEDEIRKANACIRAQYAGTELEEYKGAYRVFDPCCPDITCDDELVTTFRDTVVQNIIDSGIYKQGDTVQILGTQAGIAGLASLSEAFYNVFRDNSGINVITNTGDTGLVRMAKSPYITKFSYMGLNFDYAHSKLLDRVYGRNNTKLMVLPKKLMAMMPEPVSSIDYAGGKPTVMENVGNAPLIKFFQTKDINSAMYWHEDCNEMNGNFTFHLVLMYTCSGAYQIVDNFKSIKLCNRTPLCVTWPNCTAPVREVCVTAAPC